MHHFDGQLSRDSGKDSSGLGLLSRDWKYSMASLTCSEVGWVSDEGMELTMCLSSTSTGYSELIRRVVIEFPKIAREDRSPC